MIPTDPIDPSCWVPVFPLPNAVLLPRAVLPLHIFEQRYRVMTRDALSSDRMIAVALLKTCSAEAYFTLEAPIHDIVGVGRIQREERLPDGRYNFLLQGVARTQIVEEDATRPYRRARLRILPSGDLDPNLECDIRRRLRHILTDSGIATIGDSGKLVGLLECSQMSLSDTIDVLGSVLLPGACEKQAFLETADLSRRAEILFDAFAEIESAVNQRCAVAAKVRRWPPPDCRN